ncbi:heterodisulfide reductase subunit A [Breznakibacter xylanolyticus]|uniref:Heterodisulfide reductase subunit A n=1 Tax=Breznakibacter xylanolyticus TaxID=990 RepID=A0A2W7N2L4_9BACT|nr:NAD(P)-binding protein [Breznakibacter xylanolyticus]PZX14300.1 heterodisulfide reductase subunit A [Breznakibacter xylanolyticus]
MHTKKIAVIGAGPAGLGAASVLSRNGLRVSVFHREAAAGGHLNDWAWLFPRFVPARDVAVSMAAETRQVDFHPGCHIAGVSRHANGQFKIVMPDGQTEVADALVYAGGFRVFDASRKEELGYGIYPRVVTSADLEKMLAGEVPFPVELLQQQALRIGVVHCVGSRDEKSGNRHCSRMCCVTGVKQSIELRKRFPNSRVTAFYMDMRMFGNGYEELYLEAQRDWQVLFVRGRVSEVAESDEGRLRVKAEDTLLGRPIRDEFDLLVLMVGMEADLPKWLIEDLGVKQIDAGFARGNDELVASNRTPTRGLYLAGSCKGPLSVAEAWNDGQAAAQQLLLDLNR